MTILAPFTDQPLSSENVSKQPFNTHHSYNLSVCVLLYTGGWRLKTLSRKSNGVRDLFARTDAKFPDFDWEEGDLGCLHHSLSKTQPQLFQSETWSAAFPKVSVLGALKMLE